MINLLPPLVKEQLRYASHNAKVLHVLRLLVFSLIIISAAFGAALWHLQNSITTAQDELVVHQRKIDSYKAVEQQVAALNSRLDSIKTVQTSQTKFSNLLSDLAQITPKGVLINSIALTGDEKKPVRVAFVAPSYNVAVSFREALVSSKRIQAADIEGLTSAGGTTSGTVVISFKPGQAR